MTEPHIDFLFDFGSPNAFLVHQVVPEFERRTGARFTYIPVLLGGIHKATNNQPPSVAFKDIPAKLAYDTLESARFMRRHGIKGFHDNPFFPVNTLTIMRGAVVAQEIGVFDQYVDNIYNYMWREPRKLDDMNVLVKTFKDAGLPVDAFVTGVQHPRIKQRLVENTEYAVKHGAFGSPSFVLNGELWFGKERLRDIEDVLSGITQWQ